MKLYSRLNTIAGLVYFIIGLVSFVAGIIMSEVSGADLSSLPVSQQRAIMFAWVGTMPLFLGAGFLIANFVDKYSYQHNEKKAQ